MRSIGVLVGLVLTAGSYAPAQVPGGVPQTGTPASRVPTPGSGQPGLVTGAVQPPPPADPAVVAHLKAWEAKMAGLNNLYTTCELKREDRVLKKTKTYSGSVICMKPNLARMRMELAGDANDYTAYVCDGKAVYEYDGMRKTLTQYNIPAGNNGVGDNLLMEFMSGSLTADGALRRFDVKVLEPAKPDVNYLYFEVKPRLPKDKQEFETLRLVLFSPTIQKELQHLTYIPAMVEMATANNEKVETWTFKAPQPNVTGLKLTDFKPVDPGPTWQKVIGNPPGGGQTQPRVVRPTGPGK